MINRLHYIYDGSRSYIYFVLLRIQRAFAQLFGLPLNVVPWDYYLSKSQYLSDTFVTPPDILKLDANNEIFALPQRSGIAGNLRRFGSITILEYDQVATELAKQMYPNLSIIRGDLRRPPFQDGSFDLILDLSSIDHIPPEDLEASLGEYSRILRKEGKLLLVAWCRTRPLPVEGSSIVKWNPHNQYFFDYAFLLDCLSMRFRVAEEQVILARKSTALISFCLEKV